MAENPDNKETILNTAMMLFAKSGYESVGIQEIIEKSGVSKPTLYHYFGSKRGLLDAVFEHWGSRLYSVVKTAAEYNHDIVLNLTVLTREIISFALKETSFYRMYLACASSFPETDSFDACKSLRQEVSLCLEQLFYAAGTDHGNIKGKEKALSRTFQGMVNTWVLLVLNKEITLTDAVLYSSVHQFMYGIFS
ncbi:TetR/AcrR family transcriptional regulator [Brucepastera parasyntrophica]|uniref:TetR/AcrR family transcriptional regulator n=1 Tax=Brucepastera parasyntrophica TaxID=2880008 RepID=UPI0021090060|nr:TetR/AcrR family transcriptional regulator [Brucepastera parasyntrophica]ULQ60542.1 TetR/AcrR family transcriptional regulator [Brucepastera parasyntrophica]